MKEVTGRGAGPRGAEGTIGGVPPRRAATFQAAPVQERTRQTANGEAILLSVIGNSEQPARVAFFM